MIAEGYIVFLICIVQETSQNLGKKKKKEKKTSNHVVTFLSFNVFYLFDILSMIIVSQLGTHNVRMWFASLSPTSCVWHC